MEAKILPFKRPHMIIFERFDVDDMAALFRSKIGSDTYCFTLMSDGSLEEVFIRRDELLVPSEDFTPEEHKRAGRLVAEAAAIHKDQLSTWGTLGVTDRIALLIAWGEESIAQIKASIQAAVKADIGEYSEEIAMMCKDLECHESYLSGLETAKSLF